MSETLDPNAERSIVLKNLHSSIKAAIGDLPTVIGAVAQAGIEQSQGDVAALDLPAETLDRAREIYQDRTHAPS